jgi:hypothetical protein
LHYESCILYQGIILTGIGLPENQEDGYQKSRIPGFVMDFENPLQSVNIRGGLNPKHEFATLYGGLNKFEIPMFQTLFGILVLGFRYCLGFRN